MSKRSDIIKPENANIAKYGLVYSEILGWIDLGHAQGNDIRSILEQMRQGEAGTNDYYQVVYKQTMAYNRLNIGTGTHIRWRIKKGLSTNTKYRIALAMMMQTAYKFESLQLKYFSWYTDSGFSAEDLVSDLLGFYRVIKPMNYFAHLKIISKDDALARWDYYGPIGNFKNKTFKPLLFPPITNGINTKPYYGELPNFMKIIYPYNEFASDKVKIITNDGYHVKIG